MATGRILGDVLERLLARSSRQVPLEAPRGAVHVQDGCRAAAALAAAARAAAAPLDERFASDDDTATGLRQARFTVTRDASGGSTRPTPLLSEATLVHIKRSVASYVARIAPDVMAGVARGAFATTTTTTTTWR